MVSIARKGPRIAPVVIFFNADNGIAADCLKMMSINTENRKSHNDLLRFNISGVMFFTCTFIISEAVVAKNAFIRTTPAPGMNIIVSEVSPV